MKTLFGIILNELQVTWSWNSSQMTKDDVKSRAPETGSSNSTPINFLVMRYLIAEPFDIHDSLLAFFALVVLSC